MRSTVRVFFIACLTAVVLVPAASAADRMWVGFQDDPMLRWDATRALEMDRARENDARVLRTVVDWTRAAPERPADATNPFDPAYKLDDVDELVRNAQQRGMEVVITLWGTPGWANGGQAPQVLPRNLRDFQNFAQAIASRYSGRYPGYPFVRFFTIWNESNLATFLRPQFDKKGKIVSSRNYARLAKAGYTGIKRGNREALVGIGETSSHGRDHPKKGFTDTVAPATFMQGVAAQAKRLKLKFDAWAHHPYPYPVSAKPTQIVRYPNVTLRSMPRFEKDLDASFHRKNVPVWITEYGDETKPGEPKGVTESQQAKYLSQAFAMARKDPNVQMFVWFVLQDSPGSPWQSGIYRESGAPKPAQRRFAKLAGPVDAVNEESTVKGGTKNPFVTVYLREYCANNPVGTTVGYTIRSFQKGELLSVAQGTAPLRMDCTIRAPVTGLTIAKTPKPKKNKKATKVALRAKSPVYQVEVAANTATTGEIVRTITLIGT